VCVCVHVCVSVCHCVYVCTHMRTCPIALSCLQRAAHRSCAVMVPSLPYLLASLLDVSHPQMASRSGHPGTSSSLMHRNLSTRHVCDAEQSHDHACCKPTQPAQQQLACLPSIQDAQMDDSTFEWMLAQLGDEDPIFEGGQVRVVRVCVGGSALWQEST